jgi:hypothetical protein
MGDPEERRGQVLVPPGLELIVRLCQSIAISHLRFPNYQIMESCRSSLFWIGGPSRCLERR